MKVDLSTEYLNEVLRILNTNTNANSITVWAFGSRVSGKPKPFSDLDLALVSGKPNSKNTVWDLQDAFSDSNLPFRVDVIDLAAVSPEFKSIVEKNHTVLQG